MNSGKNANSQLSKKSIYMYGMGEFGYSFYMSLISSYLMFYMTDVILLPTALAGVLYAAVQWVEAGTSIGAGMLIDNLRSKNGRYRPWLLRGSIICMVALTIMFTNFHTDTVTTAIMFTVLYTVGYAGYNFMFIAYRSLMGVIGKTPADTVALTISGTQLSTIASLVFGVIGVQLLYQVFPTVDMGYSMSALIYGAMLVIGMAAVYRMAKPYDNGSTGTTTKIERIPVKDMLRALPPILPCSLSYILSVGASTLLFTMFAYYFNFVRNDSSMMSTLITVMTAARLAATFIVTPLAKRFERRTIYIGSVILATIFICLAYVLQYNAIAFYVLMGLYFFVLVPAGAMLMPCISDAADYNAYRKNIRARGFVYSVGSTLSYIAQFVGATVAASGLVWIGYEALLPVQTDSTLSGIAILTFFGTGALTVLSAVPMLFHRLNKTVMAEVYRLKEEETAAQNH